VEIMIRIAEEFSGALCGPVGGYGLDIEVFLRERNPLVFSVNRRGRSENKVSYSILFADLQQDDRPPQVDILIEKGLFNRGPDPCPGSQVDDEVDPIFLEDPEEMVVVSNISREELELVGEVSSDSLHILDFYIGIIKAVEVVEADHRVSFS
jgi:hypothetical protein